MATISTNIIKSKRNHFLQVEVDFDDLDNVYEDQQLNVTKDISGNDSFISKFSPTIYITHSCGVEAADALCATFAILLQLGSKFF